MKPRPRVPGSSDPRAPGRGNRAPTCAVTENPREGADGERHEPRRRAVGRWSGRRRNHRVAGRRYDRCARRPRATARAPPGFERSRRAGRRSGARPRSTRFRSVGASARPRVGSKMSRACRPTRPFTSAPSRDAPGPSGRLRIAAMEIVRADIGSFHTAGRGAGGEPILVGHRRVAAVEPRDPSLLERPHVGLSER